MIARLFIASDLKEGAFIPDQYTLLTCDGKKWGVSHIKSMADWFKRPEDVEPPPPEVIAWFESLIPAETSHAGGSGQAVEGG